MIAVAAELIVTPIVVAFIGAMSAVIVAVVQNLKGGIDALRKENRGDHMANHEILLSIDDKIDHAVERLEDRIASVEKKVDRHIEHHAYYGGKDARNS